MDIVLPVLNEERGLERSVRTLQTELESRGRYAWTVTIVDNGSSDRSWEIAAGIAGGHQNVRALRLARRGRGGALKAAWASSDSDIVAYMDIDLSTDLAALGPLLDPLADGEADISIGSRLATGSEVTRSVRREVISHAYNAIARTVLRYPVRDAQCGFKAVTRRVATTVVPLVEDNDWFFNALLVLAWRQGMRINEIPVRWVEDDDSRVRIVSTAIDDLRGIWRLASPSGHRPGPVDHRADDGHRIMETVTYGSPPTAEATPAADG